MGLCTFSVFLNKLRFSEGVSHLTESGWKFLKAYPGKGNCFNFEIHVMYMPSSVHDFLGWPVFIMYPLIWDCKWFLKEKEKNQWVDQLIHCPNKYFLYVLNFLHCAITKFLSSNLMCRFIIFQQYRIPRESLLNRLADVTVDGDYETTFTTPAQQLGKQFHIKTVNADCCFVALLPISKY